MDPYAAMSTPAQYIMAPPFNQIARPSRRSNGREKPGSSDNDSKTDEQKALEGLPVSFVSRPLRYTCVQALICKHPALTKPS